MHALLELFRFLAPYFNAASDADISAALGLADDRRPACLLTAGQDEAQVWYAAWLMYQREQQTIAAGTTQKFGVKSEKEGDISITYGFVEGAEDPLKFLNRYTALARLCGGVGAITVGNRYGTGCCHDAGY